MTSTRDAPNINPQAGEHVVSAWPVLARLPDVSGKQGAGSNEQGAQPPSREAQPVTEGQSKAGYRFDPPQPFGPHMATDLTTTTALRPGRSTTVIRTPRRRSPGPTSPPAVPRGGILPQSDLFNIRDNRPAGALSSVLQFLVLFALFTAVGSSFLLMRDADPWTPPNGPPPAAEQAAALPVATGSAATNPQPEQDPTEPATASSAPAPLPHIEKSITEQPPISEQPAAESSAELSYPTTAYPPTALPAGTERLLPQIRTTDQPPALARLPGFILEAPVHQAQDDRHQPSLH